MVTTRQLALKYVPTRTLSPEMRASDLMKHYTEVFQHVVQLYCCDVAQ